MLSNEELSDGLQTLEKEPGKSKRVGIRREVCVAA